MLVSKFSHSGPSLAMNARTTCRGATELEQPSAREPVRREAECGAAVAGIGPARGGGGKKFGETLFMGLEACNPLKSHKTAKAFFGNPCRKQAGIWKSLEKRLKARLYSAV